MNKKIFAGVLASALAVTCAATVSAEKVTADKTYTVPVTVDSPSGWNSGGSGETFVITEDGVTVTFKNEPFLRDSEVWSSFCFETIATDKADGASMTAAGNSWNYTAVEGTSVNAPTTTWVGSWGDDWATYIAGSTGNITLTAKKTAADTVTYTATYTNGETLVYTSVYPNGVPDGLEFQIGADGAKITLISAKFGGSAAPAPGGDEGTTSEGSNNTPAPTTPADKGSPETGVEGVAVIAGLAIIAAGAVVVAKKRK